MQYYTIIKKGFFSLLLGLAGAFMALGCEDEAQEVVPNSAPGSFTVSVENITSASAALVWTAASDADGNNVTYKVMLAGNAAASGLSATSYTLTGLTAETSYNGKVVAEDGNGGSSEATFSLTTADEPGEETITITYGAATSATLTIGSWTDTGADGYVIVMNTSDQITAPADGTAPHYSLTYNGYGEQVVYRGTGVSSFAVNLLQGGTDYFFRVFPYTGNYVYSSGQTASSQQVNACTVTSTTASEVCFDYSSTARTITSNQLPGHPTGSFPNADVTATNVTRQLEPNPALAGSATYIYDETGKPTPSNPNFYQFGMATNGVEFHPMGLKPWTNPSSNEENWEWQAAVVDENQTFLDEYGGHVTTQGLYHYHGDIIGLADEDGSRHSVLYGYAADGFPIYYKYGYTDKDDNSSTIKELKSGYQLKSGSRTGTGTAGTDYPDGNYDGTYIQDYEYVQGLGDLDECNGRYGVTPEYPDGIYYYVITTDFPKIPNCFMGTPDDDWIIGR
ncbi:MAG: YHYH protein [Cyclobacteriaceae bacterium]